MPTYRIAVIPGDGIGKEVVPEGQRALGAACETVRDSSCDGTSLDWGCEHYARHNRMMPEDGLQPDRAPRRDLPWRRRLAQRAGPRLALAAPDPNP